MATYQTLPTGHIRAQVRIAGFPAESGTFTTKTDAKQWVAQREAELRARKKKGAISNKTLSEAIQRFQDELCPKRKGGRWENIRLTLLARFLPVEKQLDDVTVREIVEFRDERLKSIAGPSVIREMSLLSSLFTIASQEWQWCTSNPVKGVRRPKSNHHRERVFTQDEINLVARTMKVTNTDQIKPGSRKQQDGLCFLIALETGMRLGEICKLRWEMLDADKRQLNLPGSITKTAHPRSVPLTSAALAVIERARGLDDSQVIPNRDPQSASDNFRMMLKRAGVVGATFHDTRHTAATKFAPLVGPFDLCKIFGWTDMKRALTYYNPSASDLASRLEKTTIQ
ncbi:integrase [Fluviibacter phosphoraccumulans]|uniref:tyrosine-type recombinase/integrase n=1 Tax=Fluviibacter phosphoraccumulans TaxID=1751046 RepID=UPI0013670583|nr:site-specific integrase [Fluviibacter phosphoraccumulans]BBU71881.1 integrase [Fluviibacter phosphoraccumulans]